MLKKLRKKFIIINMMLVGVVLLAVFIAVCFTTYQSFNGNITTSLEQAVSFRQENRLNGPDTKKDDGNLPSREKNVGFVPSYSVLVDDQGSVAEILQENSLLSEDVLEQAVSEAFTAESDEGILNILELKYLKRSSPDGIKIAFVDMNYLYSSMSNLLLTSLCIGIGALVVFFFISLFFSRWALRPVETAWKQQKQFVADASHELKTPLTVILANNSILRSNQEKTIKEQIKWVESTQEEAVHMRKLVDDMLFLATSDDMQSEKIMTEIDFSDIVWSNFLQFEPVAFEKHISLEQDIDAGITMLGNGTSIKQLVAILLDNACKYAGVNGRALVRLKQNQNQIVLTVENSGRPISKEDLPHVFERFYRADRARTKKQGSYGLGLAIAKSITEQHKGKITVQSNNEKTIFQVFFFK